MNNIFGWFQNAYLKAYSGKSQVMLTTGDKLKTNVGGSIYNKTTVRRLGMTVNNRHILSHIWNTVCKKVIHKLHVLFRFANYISQRKLKIIIKASLREKCPNTDFFSGPYFPVFGLNTKIYGVNLRIQSEYRKIRTRKNSVFGDFSHSVLLYNITVSLFPFSMYVALQKIKLDW